jgi:SAM-dependent methyltransferase
MTRLRPSYPACAPADRPLLYDLAYNVFDVASECDHLISLANLHGLSRIRHVLDLGCGTGHHAMYFASRGASVTAVDADRDMLRHARKLARARWGQATPIQFINGDMRKARMDRRANLAICLGASFNSLLSDDEALGTLDVVGRSLRSGGVFLLDLHDPKATYGGDLTARWTVETTTARVRAMFKMVPKGMDRYRWDIAVKATFADGQRQSTIMRTSARPWTKRQLQRLCRDSGVLDLAGWHRMENSGEAPRIIAAFTRPRSAKRPSPS